MTDYSAILIGQCLVQLSAEELPSSGEGKKYRGPQPDIVQVGDLGIHSLK